MTDQDPAQPNDQDPAQPYEPVSREAPASDLLEPAPAGPPASAPAVPIAARAAGAGGRGALRWVIALVVVALVATGGIGATMLLTSSTGVTSALAGYAPADSVMYAEARLDLPGSQRAEVAKALTAFPGFADQAALSPKLGELLDRLVKAASHDRHDYQTQIAPWFGGQIAIAQGPSNGLAGLPSLAVLASGTPAPSPTPNPAASLPPCTGQDAATPAPAASSGAETGIGRFAGQVHAVALATVTDSQKAAAWVGSVAAEAGAQSRDVTCDGTVVHLVAKQGATGAAPEAGWAILGDKILVAGDLDSVRLAIATRGTAGLATVPSFQKAVAALPGDHVGFTYQAVRASLTAQLDGLKADDHDGTAGAAIGLLEGLLPEWVAGDLKAAGGNLLADTVQPATDVRPSDNRASDLAALAPATTIALADGHDVGKSLAAIRAKAAADPKLEPYVKQLDDALGLAGGFDATLGWIGDAGFAVTRSGATVSGGILVRPDDAGAATRLFTQLRTLVSLGGTSAGIAVTDEPYKGATVTTVDLSGLAPLLGSSVTQAVPGVKLPSKLTFSYALTDKVVVLTLDPAFAKAVIDASQGGASLAASPRFSALLGQAGTKGTGLVWLDAAAVRDLVEGLLPADARAKYDADVRPYLLPIDALLSVGASDAGLQRGTMILSLKHSGS